MPFAKQQIPREGILSFQGTSVIVGQDDYHLICSDMPRSVCLKVYIRMHVLHSHFMDFH